MRSHLKQKLEHDLPKDMRSDLSAMSLFSDEDLWKTTRFTMDEDEQVRLEALTKLKKQRQLSESEKVKLNRLREAENVMLRKADAHRLLARRGYKVFS